VDCDDANRPCSGQLDNVPGGENMERIRIEHHTFMGTLWIVAWLFTIGFLHLGFWKGVFAILLWLYYLGVHFSLLVH
jgi:uncharacterized membrane protein